MKVKIMRESGFPIGNQDAIKWSLAFKQKLAKLLENKEKWEAMEPKKRERRLQKRLQVFEARLRKEYTMEAEVDLADEADLLRALNTYGDFAVCRTGDNPGDVALVVLDVKGKNGGQ